MKLNLPDVSTVNSISTINSNFAKIEEELQNKVLYRDNPSGEPNTLNTDVDANGKGIYNASTVRTTDLYIDGERVVPSGVVVVEGGIDPASVLQKANNLSDLQSAATARVNIGLGNVDNTSDLNKPVSSATSSALAAKQNTLVSGTNIKTINGNSVLGTGDLVLTGVGETNTASNLGTGVGLAASKVGVNLPFKSLIAGAGVTITPSTNDVTISATVDTSNVLVKTNNLSDVQSASTSRINLGLGNVDNTSDLNKPISTATSSALAGKQATLVSGTNIKTINGSSVLGSGDITVSVGTLNQALTGQFYQDLGARVNRIADRLYVGDAVVNDGTSTGTVKDWAEISHGNTTSVSQLAAVSTHGQIGVFGATRSSDNTIAGSESGIGICGFAYNDHPTPSSTRSVFAGYFEAQRITATAGHVQGIEIDVVNLSTYVNSDPYNMLPDGITGTLWCNAGGGNYSSNYISLAIGFLGNGTRFNKGIVFGNAIIRDDGAGQPAICMAQQQKISWYGGVNTEIARIRSDTASSSIGIIFEAGAISFRDMSDNVGFRFAAGTISAPLTDISLVPGSNYVNINSSILSGSAGSTAYYLPIKVNGTVFKLALLNES